MPAEAGRPDRLQLSDQGVDLLEDGLYAPEDKLKDPAFEEKMVEFVRPR